MQECLCVCLSSGHCHQDAACGPSSAADCSPGKSQQFNIFYTSLKVQIPRGTVYYLALERVTETCGNWTESGDNILKHWAHVKLVLLHRLFLVTWSSFLKEVLLILFWLPCPSGSSSSLDRGPRAALRQSSHQTGRAHCQGQTSAHLWNYHIQSICVFLLSRALKYWRRVLVLLFLLLSTGRSCLQNTHLLCVLYTTGCSLTECNLLVIH